MEIALVFLPLIAAIIVGVGGRMLGDRLSQFITTGAVMASFALAVLLFRDVALVGAPRTVIVAEWLQSGSMQFNWALRFDTLAAVMAVVITSVSSLVHLYSIGYMADDKSIPRFMAYLSLFTFMMLMLVTADNFVQMFFGWEGVGLASYLLIGFWHHKPTANAAAIKAFVVNRVGDFGFMLGILLCFVLFGTVNFTTLFAALPNTTIPTMTIAGHAINALDLACILLFIGAVGKSAQLGLHTWLPDAMEGPTPVSALIHAATMVTAGVFLLCRISPMLESAPLARSVIIVVGALTAVAGASIALVQFDIKKTVAYSTMSQLGYMVFAAGAGAYGAAMFHLFTHAFFKALLFLGAGAVIHAMHHEQDMRKMGGLWKKIPFTYAMMWIGSLALMGVPFFAGYYSKDMILESAFAAGGLGLMAYWLGLAAAVMTAFYSAKLMFMTFHGAPRYDTHHTHPHEAPWVMRAPLLLLAIGAVFSGAVFYAYFVGDGRFAFWQGALFADHHDVMHAAHDVAIWVKKLPIVAGVLGLLLGWLFYIKNPQWPANMVARFQTLYNVLVQKYFFDAVYDRVFARGAPKAGAFLWHSVDEGVIDRLGPDGAGRVTQFSARILSWAQSGFLYHYVFVMLIGLVVFIGWFLWRGL